MRVTRHRTALGLAALLAAAAFVLTKTGVVELPDLERALTDLSETLGAWTYALVATLAFLETGAFVGLIAPGETAIVLGGVVAAQGGVSLPLIVLVAWTAAAAGDLASFALGRRLGRPFLLTHGPRVGVSPKRLATVDGFFDRHGGKAILVGRFIGIVRAVAPFRQAPPSSRCADFSPGASSAPGSGRRLHAARLRVQRLVRRRRRRPHPRRLALAVLAAIALTIRELRRRRLRVQM